MGSFSGLAQAPGSNLKSESFKQRLRTQYLYNDTAQAIITLYGRRQAGGAGWITGSALTLARLALQGGGSGQIAGSPVTQEDPGMGPGLLVAVPFMGYGASKLVRFSNQKLEQTLTAYASGQLSPATRRKLKRRFFTAPIIEYKPVPVQPVKQ